MPAEMPTWADFWSAFDLYRDALLCGLFGGAVLGFLSVYVVLRRMVFVSAAVTQAAALGVALAFYSEIHLGAQVDPLQGAAALALITTLLLLIEPRRRRLTREGVLGLAYAVGAGAAVLVGSKISQEAHDVQALLFGTAVLVRPQDLTAVGIVGASVMVLHLWWFRGLTFASFDPLAAHVQNLPVRLLHAVVLLSIGAVVGVTARALGALPVFAMSTLPALAALALGVQLRWAFVLATGLGALSGVMGYLLAFFEELPVGASQTAVASLCVVAAVVGAALGRRLRAR